MNNCLFLFLLLFSCLTGFTQSDYSDEFKLKAIYKLTYQPDSTNVQSITSEEMWLYLGDEISKFSSEGAANKDSLSHRKSSTGPVIDFQDRIRLTRSEFDYIIYKNLPKNKISYTLEIVNDRLRYEEDKDLRWEILPERRTIKSFNSQKARTTFRGREYTAWFTSEIPISDGPYKFHGLPGLILNIQDSELEYVFELMELKILENPIPVELDPRSYILTSKEKLLKAKREFEEDPLSGIEKRNSAITITVENNDKKQFLRERRKKLERRNNPIEIE